MLVTVEGNVGCVSSKKAAEGSSNPRQKQYDVDDRLKQRVRDQFKSHRYANECRYERSFHQPVISFNCRCNKVQSRKFEVSRCKALCSIGTISLP